MAIGGGQVVARTPKQSSTPGQRRGRRDRCARSQRSMSNSLWAKSLIAPKTCSRWSRRSPLRPDAPRTRSKNSKGDLRIGCRESLISYLLVLRDWQGASLKDLVRHQLAPFTESGSERVTMSGPDILLRPEAAEAIGLALHELATNAVKYGAISVPGGHVTNSWACEDHGIEPRQVLVNWIERRRAIRDAAVAQGLWPHHIRAPRNEIA